MNDTTNTTPGVGVPMGATPQTPPAPETPVVPPFSATPASPVTPPTASAVPSFGSTGTDVPAAQTPPAWTPPAAAPAPTSTFSSPPTPVAGSASWGTPASTPAATPAWTPTPPVTPASPVPPVAASGSDFKPEHEGKSKLPLVIAGILLILAMAGGYFLYMLYQTPTTPDEAVVAESQVSPTAAPSPTMTEEEQAQMEIDALGNVSESDEVEALQQDVDNTNLDTIDSNLTPAAQ